MGDKAGFAIQTLFRRVYSCRSVTIFPTLLRGQLLPRKCGQLCGIIGGCPILKDRQGILQDVEEEQNGSLPSDPYTTR
jgi:hypothetical protein